MSRLPALPAWLGIDLGTHGVRAAVIDDDGRRLGFGRAGLGGHDRRAGPRHEQDPEGWWAATCLSTRRAMAGASDRPLDALAVASTSGTIVVRGPDGGVDGPAIMYDDARAGAQAVRADAAGHDVWAASGYRIQTSFALAKIMWLVEAGAISARHRVLHQADYIASRLVGHPVATDSSHALKTGIDLHSLTWPHELLDSLNVPLGCLPEVVLPGVVLGVVSPAAALESGIPAGTPVRAGMTDGCAAQIAARALPFGAWSSALGTTLVIKGSTARLLHDPTGVVYCHRNPDGGWLPGGASSAGAGLIARDFRGRDLGALTARAAAFEPVARPAYPLAGHGERFPFLADDACAFGLDDVDDAVRFAAVLQGLALIERLAFDVLRRLGADVSGPVTMSGGAAANRYWTQLRADILARPVQVPDAIEAAGGMAVLAAAPAGRLGATAQRMIRMTQTYEPDARRTQRFEDSYRTLCRELVERGWLGADAAAGSADAT